MPQHQTDDRIAFGAALRLARNQAGLRLQDFARPLNRSVPQMSDIEHGRRAAPPMDEMVIIARKLMRHGVKREKVMELLAMSVLSRGKFDYSLTGDDMATTKLIDAVVKRWTL